MTFWLRALPENHVMVAGARWSVATLSPGQAVEYDSSPQHDAAIAEVQAGRSPLELIESDSDPSLPAPELDEPEREHADEAERAERRRQSYEHLIAKQNPSPPPAAPEAEAPIPVPTPTTTEA